VRSALLALLLVGCAAQQQYEWRKPGASYDDYLNDRGQCQAQAFSTANVTAIQAAIVIRSCLQGKGWRSVPV
jgi:hypothetical protein